MDQFETAIQDIQKKKLPTHDELIQEVVNDALVTLDFDTAIDYYLEHRGITINNVYSGCEIPWMDFKLDCALTYIEKLEERMKTNGEQ